MRRIFDLPRHMKPLHVVVYSIIACITIFMLSATIGMLLAFGGALLNEFLVNGTGQVKNGIVILSTIAIE